MKRASVQQRARELFEQALQEWARLGIELPVVAGPALQPAVAIPLQQGRVVARVVNHLP